MKEIKDEVKQKIVEPLLAALEYYGHLSPLGIVTVTGVKARAALEQLKAENQKLRQELSAARKDLQFYALKLNYSIVDEGRNYSTELVCYELNEENYADVELGTRARQAIERIDKVLKPTQCDNNKL